MNRPSWSRNGSPFTLGVVMHLGLPQQPSKIDAFALGKMHEVGEEIRPVAQCPVRIAVVHQGGGRPVALVRRSSSICSRLLVVLSFQ